MDPLLQDQTDFEARAESDEYCVDLTVIAERRGVTENEIERALGTITEKGGKAGAVILILKPTLIPSNPDAPGPEFLVQQALQVIVDPIINDGDSGTGKTAEQIAERMRMLFHRFVTAHGTFSFAGMQPEDVEGKDSYSLSFTRLARDVPVSCGLPLIDPDEGSGAAEVTLITSTAAAEIYYTLDGSYPRAGNGTLYAAPFAPGAGVTVRAVAYKTGLIPSGVAQATFD